MALADKFGDAPIRTALFRDAQHKRRLEVRPYHRLVALCRGHKPYPLPAGTFGFGMVELSMQPVSDEAAAQVEWPAALIMVEAMHLKFFAGWEIEDTDEMLDYLEVNGDRTMRAH